MNGPRTLVRLIMAPVAVAVALAVWRSGAAGGPSERDAPAVGADLNASESELARLDPGSPDDKGTREPGAAPAKATAGGSSDGEQRSLETLGYVNGEPGSARSSGDDVFEKRYRGFTPEQLALAHGKLRDRLRVLAGELLDEKLETGPFGTTPPPPPKFSRAGVPARFAVASRTVEGSDESRVAEVDLKEHEKTRELFQEIVWLAARLPKEELLR